MSIAGHLEEVILYQIKPEWVLQVNFISCQCPVRATDSVYFCKGLAKAAENALNKKFRLVGYTWEKDWEKYNLWALNQSCSSTELENGVQLDI